MNIPMIYPLTASPAPAAPSLGERFKAAWDAAVFGVKWFFTSLSPAFAWAVVGLLICGAFFVYYWLCLRPRPDSLEWIAMSEAKGTPKKLSLTLPHHPLERKDALPILLITAVYAFSAFFQLGNFSVPQTYTQFQQGDSYTFSYDQPVTVSKVSFYTSLGSGYYTLEWSQDGERWDGVRMDQSYNTLFKWRLLNLNRVDRMGEEVEKDGLPIGSITASQFRITASSTTRPEGLWLAELALWAGNDPLVPDQVQSGGEALFDETDDWATKATYMNSTYFDEIYHPRTALEHMNNVEPYEVSHPPLGKLIISIGIAIFGMVPFGWRFMGTLFGVFMVPVLYVFLKNLFGKTPVAVCGTCLFTFDFMHLVQTRIATIDTYGVFFILVSYYFMYRWLALPAGKRLRDYALPLFLSGLTWGVGCASKWTVVYAGVGLALMWLLGVIFKRREWRGLTGVEREGLSGYGAYLTGTVALSVMFFVLIPFAIYTMSYLPYVIARAANSKNQAVTLSNLMGIMWDNQKFMFTYHQGVHNPHPYESYWYQWIFDGRPILYYRDLDYSYVKGIKSLFASFNNPLVSWAGLLSFIALVIQTIRRKCGKGLFILIAILSQFVPWLPIGRILFAYHYFPTVLFLCFAIAYLMDDMLTRDRKGCRLAVYGFTGCTVALYGVFYPALTGLYMPLWYSKYFLRWFPSWPL